MTTLVVTRPAVEAQAWQHALQTAGWAVRALPLIDIGAPADPAALAQCRSRWTDFDALMFVSAQAVQGFFPVSPSAPAGRSPRFWAPGPGTARALQRAGIDPAHIDAPGPEATQFDSEALWRTVGPQVRPGMHVLIVRGSSLPEVALPSVPAAGASPTGQGRDWLARQCEAAGARVHWCVAYERRAPTWSPEQRVEVQGWRGSEWVWLFSSSEAIHHLQTQCPQADWGTTRALVTHPRIGAAARQAGFGEIMETRPALADVLHTLETRL